MIWIVVAILVQPFIAEVARFVAQEMYSWLHPSPFLVAKPLDPDKLAEMEAEQQEMAELTKIVLRKAAGKEGWQGGS